MPTRHAAISVIDVRDLAALHAAVASNQPEIVRWLVEAGADVNARQQLDYTPLMGAAAAFTSTMSRHGPASPAPQPVLPNSSRITRRSVATSGSLVPSMCFISASLIRFW